MGLGDWIMATAQVRELNDRTGRPVVVVDRLGRARWSEAFENNPRLHRTVTRESVRLLNAGGARPYIRQKTATTWIWKPWGIQPGELYLTDEEKEFGRTYAGAVIVEPNTKVQDGNKAWIFDRWQETVQALKGLPWVQIGAPGSRQLAGVAFVPTTVRQAFGMLAAARLLVSTEGALHHAAAALKTPAVVLWSEFISPEYTGYGTQFNIRKITTVCGSRIPCSTCRDSMKAISVNEVVRAVESELSKTTI